MKLKYKKGTKIGKSTHQQLRAAGVKGGLPIKTVRKGAWERAADSGHKPKLAKGALTISHNEELALEMAKAKAAGHSNSQIAEQFEMSEGYVQQSLKKLYLTSKQGRDILKGILLENAIAFGSHAKAKISELSGMQAVVATGIMSSRFVELDKHTQNLTNEDIDFSEIAAIKGDMERIAEELGGEASLIEGNDAPSVLDIQAEIKRLPAP